MRAVILGIFLSLVAPSTFAQVFDGVFQLPYVCDTYTSLVRLHDLFKNSQQTKDESKEFIELLNNRHCITVAPQTMFKIVQRNNEAMQIELISYIAHRDPPQQSLGLYWGATEELSRYIRKKQQ